jgi:hypothetical protein
MGVHLGQQVTCRFAPRQYFYRRDEHCECSLSPCTLVAAILMEL